MTEMTYVEAACLALRQETARDPLVWAPGEDLGPKGGLVGQYRGLQQTFGSHRIVDTPISENTIMGDAVCGTRPVAELRFADFALCATDELVNQAAKIRYMFDGQVRVPLVVRQPIGLRTGIAAQHSQSTEAFWVHVPGLVVVTPSTPADNHALLKAAIRSDDPVVYMESKEMWAVRGEVDPDAEPAELGRAERVAAGPDVTIVTWSRMRHVREAAVAMLAADGIRAELLDLRTLWPWDRDAVLSSVRKTGRLLVAQEAVKTGGFGAEIVAEIVEHAFADLRAPPVRLGGPRGPVPFAKPLEDLHRVTEAMVADAARALARA